MKLRRARQLAALLFFGGMTLLFLAPTREVTQALSWMPRLQLLPAVLALSGLTVLFVAVLTLLFGRLYCSVICPLGVMQDLVSWVRERFSKKARFRYGYTPERKSVRYPVLALFVLALAGGAGSVAMLIAPYGAYGRIAQNLFAPVWIAGNNVLAALCARLDSFAVVHRDLWVRSGAVLAIAAVTFAVLAVLAWRKGRTWCNTVCPVGTVLGLLSRYALFRPVIDAEKCVHCGLCARRCKGGCLNAETGTVDGSRCVTCLNCLEVCNKGAIRYGLRKRAAAPAEAAEAVKEAAEKPAAPAPVAKAAAPAAQPEALSAAGSSRRALLTAFGTFAATAAVARAADKAVDGGLAAIRSRAKPPRTTPVAPAGAQSLRNLAARCVGCQLCVAACPNGVLVPGSGATGFLHPTLDYDRGYCRPTCTRCADVCPAGAILPIRPEVKASTQTGHAVWVRANCLPLTEGVSCGNCARHCPSGAIRMVPSDPSWEDSPLIPAVDPERCIGCGACEHVCPARPLTAIYVEGHEVHRTI